MSQPSLTTEDSPPSYTASPPSDTSPVATSSGIQLRRDADLLIRHFLPPGPPERVPSQDEQHRPDDHGESTNQETNRRTGNALPLPLCIPQISVSAEWDSAFARGYNDQLQSLGISQQMLLNFIDGLNLAISASPPLRVVSLVGRAIGFVPYHWAMIASVIIVTTAEIGIKVLSKTISDRYLRTANLNLFHPRGLSVRLCTTPAMLMLIQSSNSNSGDKKKGKTKAKLNKIGRGVGSALLNSPIPIPLAGPIVRAIADKPVPIPPGETAEGAVLRRRLTVVQDPGLALPLQFEGMPPPLKPKGVMDRMSELGVKAGNWKETRKERRNEERRRMLKRLDEEVLENGGSRLNLSLGSSFVRGLGTRGSSSPSLVERGTGHDNTTGNSGGPETQGGGFSFKKVASRTTEYFDERWMQLETEREKFARTRNNVVGRRGLLSPVLGLMETPMQRKVAEQDLLERWATDKVLWIVIMNKDNDEQIEHIEIAESFDDEERVDEETWRMEMIHEREELREERDIIMEEHGDNASSSRRGTVE
ncbi:hypothetical protein K435DRAFT_837982 [Dendrothele bispora CBS 962.96]|uniref:Uncharacterized protein n=1 Tax=Dendrothele bispora (strain CBS 962.96) TaxID=1314807 RepID=A0A4S8M8I2_DENBC|nr:hypothetical protein K435DRAFT_837982 [Dendrothele bispora CBS 962.96]